MSLLDDQPLRMAREKLLLEALARTESWFGLQAWNATATGGLEVRFTLKLANGYFDGLLAYPRLFPDVPAYIRPLRKGESWSGHQYLGSGVLCLERGPDNWDPSVTGADLVRSANKLLWSEVVRYVLPELGPVPSRHHLSEGQALRGERCRFLLTTQFADQAAALAAGSMWVMSTAKSRLGDEEVTITTGLGPEEPKRLVGVPLVPDAESCRGLVVAVQATPSGMIKTLAELAALTGIATEATSELYGKTLFVCDARRLFRAFSVPPDGQITELTVVETGAHGGNRLPAQHTKLSGMTVAIAGLGSLGSKIAVALARSGIRRFQLLDADVLLPHNLVRNDLDWRHVGFSKVDAVAERIRLVSPGANVATFAFEVGGQENPLVAAEIGEIVGTADLVIDATANASAFAALAALCSRHAAPLVWGEVFAGGIGALMARSRPGRDVDPLSIRAHVFGEMESMAPAPRGAAMRYALETSDEVLVADDAAVGQLAAAMTAFAIDAVSGGETPDYPVAAYLLGFKKAWEFKAPFDTIPIECPAAAPPVAAQPLTAVEAAALHELSKVVQRSAGAAVNGSG